MMVKTSMLYQFDLRLSIKYFIQKCTAECKLDSGDRTRLGRIWVTRSNPTSAKLDSSAPVARRMINLQSRRGIINLGVYIFKYCRPGRGGGV